MLPAVRGTPLLFAACGSRTPLACQKELTVGHDVPSLYFVLDRSASMMENGKWDVVRSSISGLIGSLGTRARFGAAEFPAPNAADGCTTGGEVMSLREGDDTGATVQAFLDATADDPEGGTPTAATLTTLLPTLTAEVGPTFVILATDGGPNCNDALMCDVSTCTANIDHVSDNCNPGQLPDCCDPSFDGQRDCLDEASAVSAVQAVNAAGIPVYVIGVPGSGPYAQVLDALAEAGGTARATEPRYYDVNTSDKGALAATLEDVARRVNESCFMRLDDAPTNVSGMSVEIAGQPVGGWSYDPKTQILALRGAGCNALQAGAKITILDLDQCAAK